jgi:hypothetical protein
MIVPRIGSVWKHRTTGNVYEVYDHTNTESTRPEEYPLRISYKRLGDGTTWSRSASLWHASYIELPE